MPASGYTAITFVASEQPTTAKWNLIGSNDASFNTGAGFNDGIIVNRHMAALAVKSNNMDLASIRLGVAQMTAALSNVSSATLIPGLTLNITIPSGLAATDYLEVIVSLSLVYNNTAGGFARLNLWQNGVGSGTQLFMAQNKTPASTGAAPADQSIMLRWYLQNPTPGAMTLNASLENGGTGLVSAGWSNTSGLKYGGFMTAKIV